MRDLSWMRRGAKNLALLVLVFIPLFLLLSGMLGRIGGRSTTDVPSVALVLYPAVLGPVLLGGLVYLGCLFTALGYVGTNARVLAVALTPLIALGFVPFEMGHILTIAHFLIAFTLSLAVYGFLVRLPNRQSSDRGGAPRDTSPSP